MKMIARATIFILKAMALISGVAAAPCDTLALSKLLVNPSVISCRADSGYNPAFTMAATDAQITAMCKSNACTQAMDDLKEVAPNECTVGPVRLYADLIDPLEWKCGRKSNPTSAAGSVSASGSGSGPMVGDVGAQSTSDSGSGPIVGDDDSLSASGSAANTPTIIKPRTNAPASPGTDSPSPAPTSGGSDILALSTFAVIVILATMVATIV